MYSVPQVQRDFPQQLKDVAGRHLAWGEAFTEPLTFRLSNRAFRERMEIIPMEPGHSIIIPEWWREELGVTWRSDSTLPGGYEVSFGSTPKELQKPSQLESDGINGAHIDDDAEGSFNIEWDDSLLSGDELPGQIGSILTTNGVPKMLPNGTWVPTSSLRVSISSVGPTDKEMLLRLPKRYHPFLKLFSRTTAQKLPEHSVYDHTIPLIPETSPPWGPIYPMSQAELDALREYLDDMLKSGKIRPSQSPAGAPILFVPKPHGRGLRLCVDYRGLNKITVKNRYPLPLMDELRNRVQGSTRFTKIDLKSGYNLVRVAEGEEWKTAFRTRYGHFEYRSEEHTSELQ